MYKIFKDIKKTKPINKVLLLSFLVLFIISIFEIQSLIKTLGNVTGVPYDGYTHVTDYDDCLDQQEGNAASSYNYYVKSNVHTSGPPEDFLDVCLSDLTLREYACSEWRSYWGSYKNVITHLVDCPNGCSDGACLPALLQMPCSQNYECTSNVCYNNICVQCISDANCASGKACNMQTNTCEVCIQGEKRCSENILEVCSNNAWITDTDCSTSMNQCKLGSPNQKYTGACANEACVTQTIASETACNDQVDNDCDDKIDCDDEDCASDIVCVQPTTLACGSTITSNVLLASDMSCSTTGAAIYLGADNIVLDCQNHELVGNGQGTGIQPIAGRNFIMIRNCTVKNFETGIGLRLSNNNTIINNKVTNNKYGVYLSDSYYNLFYNNYFEDNSNKAAYQDVTAFASSYTTVETVLHKNYWNTTKNCIAGSGQNIVGGDCIGGNYWDRYTTYPTHGGDSNNDGIGDTMLPYHVGSSGTAFLIMYISGDYLPLVFPRICTENEKRCSGNVLEVCSNNAWITDVDCSALTGQCNIAANGKYTGTCWQQYLTCTTEPVVPETSCTDNSDNDCDGKIDCTDEDCSQSPSCITCTTGQRTGIEYCFNNAFLQFKQVGDSCTEDYECTSNICYNNKCVQCSSDNDCASGEVCNIQTNTCEPLPVLECISDADCEANEYCDAQTNTCEPAPITGCTSNTECTDQNSCTVDICSNGDCSNSPIIICNNDDGCCPSNCGYSNDDDCPPPCTDNFYTFRTAESKDVCIQPGIRISSEAYCNSSIELTNQKEENETCSANYECKSNICSPESKCITYSALRQAYCSVIAQLGLTSSKCQ